MAIGVQTIELHLPGVHSLKAKRSIMKSLLARLHREFNVSCAEVDLQDTWQSAVIGVAAISSSAVVVQQVLDPIPRWIEVNRPDVQIVDSQLEVI